MAFVSGEIQPAALNQGRLVLEDTQHDHVYEKGVDASLLHWPGFRLLGRERTDIGGVSENTPCME